MTLTNAVYRGMSGGEAYVPDESNKGVYAPSTRSALNNNICCNPFSLKLESSPQKKITPLSAKNTRWRNLKRNLFIVKFL